MFCWTPTVIRKKRYFIPVPWNFLEMPIGIPFLCQQHEDILERMRICPLFFLPNTRQRRPASTARTFTMKGLDRFIIKGVTPRIPCGLPSRWSPTRGSNQAELIMQRLCYSLHRSINGTRIHVQIIFGTTNCHSGLPSSSVVVWWLSSYVRCTERRLMSFAILVCRIRLLYFVVFLYEKGNGDGRTTTIEMKWNSKHGDDSFCVNTICGLASCFVHVVVVGLFIYDDYEDACKKTLQITTLPFEWIIGYHKETLISVVVGEKQNKSTRQN